MDAETRTGWLCLAMALAACLGPTAVFIALAKRWGEDIGWQEGGGFIVFVWCLAAIAIGELLTIGFLTYRFIFLSAPGRWALAAALLFLLLAVAIITILGVYVIRGR
jgi:peptidoglycan biosynthesis protein MviN/MurJ (putative lipid II flippase)